MATTKKQRLGILVILIVTVIGTVGSFAVMVLATKNDAADSAKQQKAVADYQAKVNAQTTELSNKYYPTFSPNASRVATFDPASVTELKTEDLVVGDGEEITGTTVFSAYYIGWNPKGKIFDQSIDGKKLKDPIPISTGLDTASLIDGWKEGLKGMKMGGIRELTIPSEKAYKDQDKGDDIPPNTPLKFIVMAVPTPEPIAIPQELYQSSGN